MIGFTNKAVAHIAAAITTGETQVQVQDLEYGAILSAPGESVFLMLRGPVNRELIKVDIDASIWGGGLSNYLTVERGQGSTTAKVWPAGSMMFATTHEDHYNAILQRGIARTISYNPNQILSPLFAGEKVYQDSPAGCERWWISFNGTDPYWDIITGQPCGAETYQDIGWDYELLMASDPWSEKQNLSDYDSSIRWLYSLCYDSSRHNLFIGTKYNGFIFKSTDGGANWTLSKDTGTDRVRSLVYDAYHDALVAGTGGNGDWWRSTDGGANWSEVTGLNQEVTTLCYAPDTHTIIAGTFSSAKIYKSTDGGLNWTMKQNLGSPSPWESDVSALAYDSSRSRFICGTGKGDGSLWVSTDDGDTWVKKKALGDEGNPQDQILSMCYDIENDAIICGTYNDAQLWRSTDGGETWSLIKDLSLESPSQYEVNALFYNPDNHWVFAGSAYESQVWISKDGGDTWTMEQELENVNIYAFAHDSYHGKLAAAVSSSVGPGIIWTRGDS
jgi:photosystem II stability/assembly factor-like uncharacterized protein